MADQYQGNWTAFSGLGSSSGLAVATVGETVRRVSVLVSASATGWVPLADADLQYTALYLQSPSGTIIALYEKYDLEESGLFQTFFDDRADKSILHSLAPYFGPHRPVEPLAEFNAEWSAGTWTIVGFNDGVNQNFNVQDWVLYINEAPTPSPTPTPDNLVCLSYVGDPMGWSSFTGDSTIYMPDIGIVDDIDVYITAHADSDFKDVSMYLISPTGESRPLFEYQDLSGKDLYRTMFDDEAGTPITQGVVPYVGPYKPRGDLSAFDGESVTGNWTLFCYNASDQNVRISDWGIRYCFIGSTVPPRTPTPTPETTVTPTPQPSPITTPTRSPATPTPSPSPALICHEYWGSPFSWTGISTAISRRYVSDENPVQGIKVFVSAHAGESLDMMGLYLISPAGNVSALFEKHQLAEHELYQTLFEDSAFTAITDDVAPYLGPHRPVEALSSFYGEWMAGTWTLVVYNDSASNPGWVSEWALDVCSFSALVPTPTASPTPLTTPRPSPTTTLPPGFYSPTPPPTASPTPSTSPTPTPLLDCTDYQGSFMSWTTIATKTSVKQVFTNNEITDVKVRVTAQVNDSLDWIGMYLMSPEGTLVTLFEKHQLDEHQLFWTWFDDTAWSGITSGVANYIGSYRPVEPLRAFRGEWTEGTWVLIAYNDSASNAGQVTDWILELCTDLPPVPTPTPSIEPGAPTPTPAGNMMPIIASGDYNGDGTSDIGFFRPATGLWSIRDVGTDFFGSNGDIPVSGDYDGDGTADIGVWRASESLWNVRGVTRYYFGAAGDIPAPGDYDGDGACDPAIFRHSTGFWFSPGLTRFIFGAAGDIPIPADYNDDGTDDIGIFRPSSILWSIRGLSRAYFGASSDYPVPARYSGAGARISIFRQSGGLWVMQGLSRFYFGSSADLPVPANYRGDGADVPAIFRSSTGLWSVRDFTRAFWGSDGDVPVTR
jgi:subtilisin-like proprotein convertase family protein